VAHATVTHGLHATILLTILRVSAGGVVLLRPGPAGASARGEHERERYQQPGEADPSMRHLHEFASLIQVFDRI
jgi:hypothetical protein